MTSEQLKCVENVEIDYSTCTNKCEGLEIIGYDELDVDSKWTRSLAKILKIEKDPKLARNMELFSEQYRKYKGVEYASKMHYVKILFKTPKFDRITKDRAAKFVDILSAIGGTMGLLTGFSIISGIEIVYFATKIILGSIKKDIAIK